MAFDGGPTDPNNPPPPPICPTCGQRHTGSCPTGEDGDEYGGGG